LRFPDKKKPRGEEEKKKPRRRSGANSRKQEIGASEKGEGKATVNSAKKQQRKGKRWEKAVKPPGTGGEKKPLPPLKLSWVQTTSGKNRNRGYLPSKKVMI